MNKLEGFFELNSLGLPTIKWKAYREGDKFDDCLLWTVRTAVAVGDDFNLPRKVGVTAGEAEKFALSVFSQLGENGMVIYYPFFVAEVSGTITVSSSKTTIECVLGDLWNLVTHGLPNLSLIFEGDNLIKKHGEDILSNADVDFVLSCAEKLKRAYRRELAEGDSVYAEWSFAFNSDALGMPTGERYPVFYELRIIK